MEDKDLPALKALAQELNGAQWCAPTEEFTDAGHRYREIRDTEGNVVIGECGPSAAEAEYIAYADPATILSLIARVEQAEKERDDLRERLARSDEVASLCVKQAARIAAMASWLEANQPDVFRRRLWDAIGNAPVPTTKAASVDLSGLTRYMPHPRMVGATLIRPNGNFVKLADVQSLLATAHTVEATDDPFGVYAWTAHPSGAAQAPAQAWNGELPAPFFYYRANKDNSIEWGEDCCCQDDVYTNEETAAEYETHGGKVYSEAQVRKAIGAALAGVRDGALEEAAKACEAQNDTEWPTPLGCAKAVRKLKTNPASQEAVAAEQPVAVNEQARDALARKFWPKIAAATSLPENEVSTLACALAEIVAGQPATPAPHTGASEESPAEQPSTLPTTPEQVIAFIGPHFGSKTEAETKEDVRYTLSVHDLLSAFSQWEGFEHTGASVPQGWISVDDRLPPKGESVLVFYPKDDAEPYRIDMWDEYHEDPIGMGGPTICTGEGWLSYEDDVITHWMPLPASPAPSGMEEKKGGEHA